MAVIKEFDIGAASAYAIAVEHGYTGTEEEFAADMGNSAKNAMSARNSQEAAELSATAAAESAKKAEDLADGIEASTSQSIAKIKSEGSAQIAGVKEEGEKQTANAKEQADRAEQYALDAGAAKDNAATSATAAKRAETAAETAKAAAETARGGAESAQESAVASATAAAESATEAADSAEEAAQAAQDAKASDAGSVRKVVESLTAYPLLSASSSSSPATLPNASANPVKSLSAHITPVQDLHGYSKPWPGGAGKNLLEITASTQTINGITFTVNKDSAGNAISVTANGTSSNSTVHLQEVGRFSLKAGQSYVLSGCPSGGGNSTYSLTVRNPSDGDYSNITPRSDDSGSGLTFTSNVDQVARIAIRVPPNGTVSNVVFRPMLRLASESDSTFAPYSNICPIEGYDTVKVIRTGKNVLPMTLSSLKNLNTSGTWNGNAYTLNGVTFTIDVDGDSVNRIIATGTAGTSNAGFRILLHSVRPILPGSYVLSGDPDAEANTHHIYINAVTAGGTLVRQLANTYQTRNFTIDYADYEALSIGFTVYAGTTVNNLAAYPMIRPASITDDTYEPYQAQTALTPLWLPDGTGPVSNLLEITATTQTVNGVTFTVDKVAGTVTVNGTASAKAEIIAFTSTQNFSGMVLSGCPAGGSTSTYQMFIGLNGSPWTIYTNDIGNGNVIPEYSASSIRVVISIESGQTVSDLVFRPLLRAATDAVYGGTLDVLTGELVVKYGCEVFDGSSDEGWTMPGTQDTSTYGYRLRTNKIKEKVLLPADNNTKFNGLCSDYEIITANQTYVSPPKTGISVQGNLGQSGDGAVQIYDPNYNTADKLSAWGTHLASSPLQLVYELATPITYHLTPAQMSTLLGYNRIAANCGTVDVTYRADMALAWDEIQDKTIKTEFAASGLFGADDTPKEGSALPITSGGVYAVLQEYLGDIQAQNPDYEGVDLTAKFANEIAVYGNDPWRWVKARLTAKNVKGLHIKDYIRWTSTNGYVIEEQIGGINHYLGFGDTEITAWSIDFISRNCWPDNHVWNKVNYNNGLESNAYPYLVSDLKAWLNAEKANVPNAATVNPETVEVDYTTTGLWALLPSNLKNVIVNKRVLLSNRYSASGLLTDDTGWGWQDLGKLWIPAEMEVYGCTTWGTKGWSQGMFTQYPIFRDSKMRIKRRGSSNSRCGWWLLTPRSGNSTGAADVGGYGDASGTGAAESWLTVPVCFRISG